MIEYAGEVPVCLLWRFTLSGSAILVFHCSFCRYLYVYNQLRFALLIVRKRRTMKLLSPRKCRLHVAHVLISSCRRATNCCRTFAVTTPGQVSHPKSICLDSISCSLLVIQALYLIVLGISTLQAQVRSLSRFRTSCIHVQHVPSWFRA